MQNEQEIIRAAMAAFGRKGGKSTSPAKQAAARANGKKGGGRKAQPATPENKPRTPLLLIAKEQDANPTKK